MITLTAEIVCDTCKRVIASGSPTALSPDLPLAEAAIEDALIKATNRGAVVGVSSAICRECQDKTCPTCGGEGGVDSGGVTPWGAGINIPCPSCNQSEEKSK